MATILERQARSAHAEAGAGSRPAVVRRAARLVSDGSHSTVMSTTVKRVALIAPSGAALRRAFEPLIGELKRRQQNVLCICTDFAPADAEALEALGAERRAWPAGQPKLKLLAEWSATGELSRIFREWRPHVVVAASPQQIVHGALAARRVGVARVVAMIGDTGEGAAPNGLALPPPRRYRRALEACDAAIFRHREGQKALAAAGILPPELPAPVISAAGIDLEERSVAPLPPVDKGLVFLMATPLERAAGVLDFAAAAATVKRMAPSARFLLAGTPANGPGAVTPEEIEAVAGPGIIDIVSAPGDMPSLCAQCHVLVDPARSGNRSILSVIEAMAAGRPVIVSDVPGHRDTVDDRVNGCIVPAGNAPALAAAMESFLRRPDLIPAAARASRAKAERRFDRREMNRTLLTVLGLE